MECILQQIQDWLKEMLISGIMNNLSGLFDSVNDQVGDIATQVGTSPASFSPGMFSLIRNVSESVIVPIAGIILVQYTEAGQAWSGAEGYACLLIC